MKFEKNNKNQIIKLTNYIKNTLEFLSYLRSIYLKKTY